MPDTMTLAEALAHFLDGWPAEAPAPGTLKSYSKALRALVQFAHGRGAVQVLDLNAELVRAAMVAKYDGGGDRRQAPNFQGGRVAAANLLYAARFFLRWLARQGFEVADLSSLRAPRAPQRVQPRLTAEEFARLERTVVDRMLSRARGQLRIPHVAISRDLALLNVLAETGLRANECCRLTLDDIDVTEGWILVHGKGAKQRVLSIMGADEPDNPECDPERVVRLVRDWIDTRRHIARAKRHRYLWTSTKGTPLKPDELRRVLGRLCLEAGLDGNRPPHAFRRYVFTEHYRSRPTAIRQLAARMGWSESSDQMISVYTHGVALELARERIPLLSTRARVRTTAKGLDTRVYPAREAL